MEFEFYPRNTMSDYQQIPGNIRSLLATTAQTWTDQTADLARQYAALCDETNQRLRRCNDYLARGMGSAAIHLAECQPNLSQTVLWLEFPERTAWAELCVIHGIHPPAILETECLPELKRAYERETSLKPLLSRHRLLALAKSPLRARLEIARLLAAEDQPNQAWPNEILSLESARLDEINAEATVAIGTENEDAAISLLNELAEHRGQQDIVEALRTKLQQMIAGCIARRVQAQLPDLAEEITATFHANPAEPRLSDLVQKWMELTATCGVTLPGDLRTRVQPVVDWTFAEAKRKKALAELKSYGQLFQSAEPTPATKTQPKRGVIFAAVGDLLRFSKK